MGDTLFHGDDRVEQYLEVGHGIACGMGGNSRGQVTTCREAHDANVLGIDVPLLGIAAHQTGGFLSILGRYCIVAMRHAVFHDDEGNALTIKELGPVVSLVVHGQMLVATTRTAYHSPSGSLLGIGQIHPYLGHVVGITIAGIRAFRPQIHLRTFLG